MTDGLWTVGTEGPKSQPIGQRDGGGRVGGGLPPTVLQHADYRQVLHGRELLILDKANILSSQGS